MKQLLFLVTFLCSAFFAIAQVNSKSVYVKGYTRSNGTYVEPHYRTAPNKTINDNYSTYPNVNPYTGKQGTISPEPTYKSTPSYSQPSYSSPTYSSPSYNTPSNNYPSSTTPSYNSPTYSSPTYNSPSRGW